MTDHPPRSGNVWVIGSINLDQVIAVDRHPRPGETINGRDQRLLPGGKGANQGVAAAAAGAHVTLVGRIGNDNDGAKYRDQLTQRGIDTQHLLDTPAVATGRAIITVADSGENTIVVIPGANHHINTETIDTLNPPIDAVILLQLEIPARVVAHAAHRFAGHRIVFNPSPISAFDPALFTAADPLIVNQHEAAQLTGTPQSPTDDPQATAARLLSLGAKSAVITLGAAGAVVAEPTNTTFIPAAVVTAIDTTGAGDVFAGTLAAGLAAGGTLTAAATTAVQKASNATTWRGAQGWEISD